CSFFTSRRGRVYSSTTLPFLSLTVTLTVPSACVHESMVIPVSGSYELPPSPSLPDNSCWMRLMRLRAASCRIRLVAVLLASSSIWGSRSRAARACRSASSSSGWHSGHGFSSLHSGCDGGAGGGDGGGVTGGSVLGGCVDGGGSSSSPGSFIGPMYLKCSL